MKPRQGKEQEKKAPAGRREEQKPKLQIVKLEERIAPRLAANHNETLVRGQKPKLQIVKLEERIAPSLTLNHNETLVRERSACAR
jgi:hypothetical protein